MVWAGQLTLQGSLLPSLRQLTCRAGTLHLEGLGESPPALPWLEELTLLVQSIADDDEGQEPIDLEVLLHTPLPSLRRLTLTAVAPQAVRTRIAVSELGRTLDVVNVLEAPLDVFAAGAS